MAISTATHEAELMPATKAMLLSRSKGFDVWPTPQSLVPAMKTSVLTSPPSPE